MMLLWENMKLACSAIRVNKMRSFLTMLGIIIGISAVIAIVSIGDTMRSVMAEQYASIGVNRVMMYVGYVDDNRASDNFTLDDVEKMKDVFPDRIDYIMPNAGASGTISHGRTTLKASVATVGADYDKVQPMDMIYGRMINQADLSAAKHHTVLEQKTAKKLFGRDNVVGQTIRVVANNKTEDFVIVGVYKEKASFLSAMLSGGGSQDSIYAPYTVFVGPQDPFFALDFYMAEGIDTEVFKQQATGMVSRMKNRTADQIVFYAAKDEMGMMDTMMSSLSIAVGAIAAISLLVGGIGIMNIMLVSVTERTREIGIRKALGARTKDIMIQFLIESALVSAAGGLIGTGLGVGFVMLGGALLGVPVVINPMIVVVAVAFSAIVGIFFGIYPASKAAKADPITALRYE